MSKTFTPLFIFSLPRSGSTLLQRVLASHSKISSFAEPHFLLPFISMIKKEGTLTKYSHQSTYKGVRDIVDFLPGKEKEYFDYLRSFSLNIYESISEEKSIYFLDKTPRYLWVIPEITKIFPNAKFIFLFRNPIQIYASLMTTFCSGKFYKMYRFNDFLKNGFELLSENFTNLKQKSIAIQYEKFIDNPELYITKLFDYLELEPEMEVLKNFNKYKLKGKSVDPTGIKMYDKLSKSPLKKWEKVFHSKYRNRILQNYIKNLNEVSLSVQGYNKNDILNEVNSNKVSWKISFFSDFWDIQKSKMVQFFKLNLFFDKKLKWVRNQYLS